MAKADDTTSTKRIWWHKARALVAEAYGTEKPLIEALAKGQVQAWDGSGSLIKPEFWRLNLEFKGNSASERTYRFMVLSYDDRPGWDSSGPPGREHHNISLAHADVLVLLSPGAQSKQRRRRYRRDPVEAVRDELWPGGVPEKLSTPDAVKTLGDECQDRGIPAGLDTLLRALGRR
jgi:hypothetical protein